MTKNGFFVTTPTPTIGKNTRKGLVFQSLSAFLNGQNFWHLKGVLPILCFLCLSPFSILEPINARMPVCRGCAGDITRFIHPNVSDACKASLLSSPLFLPCFVVPQYFPTWLRNPLESTPVPWSCNGVHPLELEMHCYTHFTAVWDALLHASSEALAPLLMRRQLKKENASNWKSPHQKCLSASTRATPARDRCSGGLLSWRQVHYLKSLGSL